MPIRVDADWQCSVGGFFAPYDAPTNPIIPSTVGAAEAANLGNVEVWEIDEAPAKAPDEVREKASGEESVL